MSEIKASKLTVFYTNGSKQVYAIPKQGEEGTLPKRLAGLRQENQLIIRTKDKLIMIPYQNILRIEVEPFPRTYPANVLNDAVLIEG